MPVPTGGYTSQLGSPATRLFAITPTNGVDLVVTTRAIFVGVGGDISIIPEGQEDAVVLTVPDGILLPIQARRVPSTGTTATGIVGMY